ncbi:CDGSH iron-sulfur domain-containing protein [Blastococcus sp. TF02-8]|uniref:CDGSH iron-sulfur domain-containing protein n=1 Tax=Blastococcus sp. TF02-8 TaxID=2250574 RepID=UPI001F0C8A9E|nr:CDGSH iron-sulfur domain-containing protein [Blastococcus sp. TF02-8]
MSEPDAGQGDDVSAQPAEESPAESRRFDEDLPTGERGSGTTITPYRDGPLIVRGDFRLLDQDGAEIDPGRETIALCRCGKSGIKPFCDGSHKRAGFSAPSAPSRPRPAAQLRQEG